MISKISSKGGIVLQVSHGSGFLEVSMPELRNSNEHGAEQDRVTRPQLQQQQRNSSNSRPGFTAQCEDGEQ